jgi:Asp-tRNA(Asn)/Glu-tRNA(Gln) amidotransferase A subunit family amidase
MTFSPSQLTWLVCRALLFLRGQMRQGLPLGLQLIGRPWEEGDLLNSAYALERAAGFVAKPTKWW